MKTLPLLERPGDPREIPRVVHRREAARRGILRAIDPRVVRQPSPLVRATVGVYELASRRHSNLWVVAVEGETVGVFHKMKEERVLMRNDLCQ